MTAGTGLTGGGTSGELTLTVTGAPWSGLTGVPAGFADGVDNDSDHSSSYWSLTGNSGTTAGANFLGTTDNVTLTLAVSGTAALRLAPNATSPNLIGGYSGNSVTTGVVAATIAGGGASGNTNSVTDDYGTVGGGRNNRAGDNAGTTSDNPYATVGGGESNTASNDYATVAGGGANMASAIAATVGGGSNNTASGENATTGGGSSNSASGLYSTVGGGSSNTASGGSAAVGGGAFNTASGSNAIVGGGRFNSASGENAAVAGGNSNTASGENATVGGGAFNTASGWNATVGGGESNTASGSNAIVGGGFGNAASGENATVAGGRQNTAGGDYSFAAGRRAKIGATHDGSFLFADQTNADFNSDAANQFAVRASGGYKLYSNSSATVGVEVAAGGNSWSVLSDRNLKENFAPVNGLETLRKVLALPVATWNVKSQAPSIRHLGPMAQDFYAAFGLGEDDRHITTVDADGVALAAIQGLYEALLERDARIGQLEARLAALEARIGGGGQ